MVLYNGSISVVKYFRDNILDGTVVFTLLFRSELFEDYIGHLAMATMASTEMTTDNRQRQPLKASGQAQECTKGKKGKAS